MKIFLSLIFLVKNLFTSIYIDLFDDVYLYDHLFLSFAIFVIKHLFIKWNKWHTRDQHFEQPVK